MTDLLVMVAYEQDPEAALDHLNQAALELTGSRNAMIARLNDELGCLELSHGIGTEWGQGLGERLKVNVSTAEGIVAYVAATGKSFRTGDVRDEPRYKNLFGTTMSEIAVPIRDRFGRIRAVLNVESDRKDAYGEDAEKQCEQIAILAAIVLERQESQTREQALLEVANSLDKAWTEEELTEGVIRVAGEVLRFQAFSVFLHDAPTDTFVLRGSVGPLRPMVGKISYRKGEGTTGWVAETGIPVLLDNPTTDPRWRGLHVEFPSEQIASFLAVPIAWRDKTIGILRAVRRVSDNKYLDNRFTESDQTILTAVAEHMATVLQSIRSVQRMVHSERMAAWGELSAKSSHMIGNRMFAIRGDVNELGYLLDEEELNRSALKEIYGHLTVGVTRMEEILQDFRDFLTANQLHREPTDINEFVEETVEEMSPHRGDTTLKLELEPGVPLLDVDRRRLRRAISELIENAFLHVQAGTVRVSTRLAKPDDLRAAGLRERRRYATIEVEDTGPGVSPEDKQLIFQPFFSGRVKGMGLGLSIVKGIVDAHGGGIYEGGEPGRGAKFIVLLPFLERSKTG